MQLHDPTRSAALLEGFDGASRTSLGAPDLLGSVVSVFEV
ncbi:MAG: hypothetical protein H6Q90_6980, partial [Deltaproteobacteria bacterium]|nr:hypothetical protein [Deltaproteobacteria bacterium]